MTDGNCPEGSIYVPAYNRSSGYVRGYCRPVRAHVDTDDNDLEEDTEDFAEL